MTDAQQAMPAAETIIARLRQALPRLRQEYAVASLALFGSFVRAEQRDDSDVDILVTFRAVPGLLTFIALEQELADTLHRPVDLVMDSALKPEIAARVYAEMRPV